jgi:hypothetical protein
VTLIFLNIIVDQIWLKATIFGLLMMAITLRTAAARAGGGEEKIVTMSVVSGDDAVGGEADDAMQVGDRRYDDRGGRATATSDNWRRQL